MWPSILTVENFVSPAELEAVRARVDAAAFQNGDVSAAGANLSVKNNEEMVPGQEYVDIVKLVERGVRTNPDINYTVFPRSVTKAIVSRYDVGMSYGVHIDSPVMGFMAQGQAMGPFGQNYVRSDFSMTVFLSEPDSYDGGELSFDSPWGKQLYKLPAGSAIVYPTGMRHEVTEVTRGSRSVVVLWMQSMIRDQEQRRLAGDMNVLARQLTRTDPGSAEARSATDLAATALRLFADI